MFVLNHINFGLCWSIQSKPEVFYFKDVCVCVVSKAKLCASVRACVRARARVCLCVCVSFDLRVHFICYVNDFRPSAFSKTI